MKLALSLILASGLVSWLSISEPLVAQSLDDQKKQLEVEKMKVEIEQMKDTALDDEKKQLEIDKLKKEIEQIAIQEQQGWITLVATTLGSTIAFLGLGWTIFSGLKTINQQIKEARQNRISSLLQSLSSEKEYLRLGAAKGLSQYVDYCVMELLTSSSTEESVLVRNNLEDTLSLVGDFGKRQVLESNNKTLLERLEIVGQIQSLRAKDQTITIDPKKLSGFSEQTLKKLRQVFNVQYEYGQKISSLYLDNLPANPPAPTIQDYIKENIEPISVYLKKLNQMTSNVIAIWLKKGINLEWFGSGIDLSATNLYRAKIVKFNGVGCIFNYALMRHSDLSQGSFENCLFYDADMYDCNINSCNMKGSDLSKAHLREASGVGVILDDCILCAELY